MKEVDTANILDSSRNFYDFKSWTFFYTNQIVLFECERMA